MTEPAPARAARERIETERLALTAPSIDDAPESLDFYLRNIAHFARWDPPRPPGFHSLAWQRTMLVRASTDFRAQAALRYWVRDRASPTRIIGNVSFSQIARGPFQSAMLGYSVDVGSEGRGLMAEALRAALDEVFSERVALHRVQANARVENERSLRLLDRLGFEREGLARRYLFIDGDWRDHVMTALRSPLERAPE
jgi:ribosomal-protein-alanine N-acetyltransferase